MHTLTVTTDIAAPVERCFDLARDLAAHARSAAHTGERIIAGPLDRLLELGDAVTFEARHLGVRQRLSATVTAFDRPRFFQDRMTRGAFRTLEHGHYFDPLADGRTRMTDVVRFVVPGEWAGRAIGMWVVGPHLRAFLTRRGLALRDMAEATAT